MLIKWDPVNENHYEVHDDVPSYANGGRRALDGLRDLADYYEMQSKEWIELRGFEQVKFWTRKLEEVLRVIVQYENARPVAVIERKSEAIGKIQYVIVDDKDY